MLGTARLVTIFLGLSLTAFLIATIVLAVQKSDLKNELQEAKDKLDALEEALKTTTTTITPTSSSSSSSSSTTSSTSTSSTTTGSTTENPGTPTDYRLPDTLIPTHYDLYLNPDIDTGNFSGQVTIVIDVIKSTDRIILHSNNLVINSLFITNSGINNLEVRTHYFDLVREFLIIELNQNLIEGRSIRLGLTFEGSMAGKIVGLYSSSYLKADESRKWIATSKFEPTYARQAFPCFDEPAMKATFEITLVHPSDNDYHALSNMNVMLEQNQGSYREVFFEKSVPMSTYLTCFIVSDFKYKSKEIDTKQIGAPFDLRVFATPEQIDKVDFALDVGKTVIEYYIDYFQIEYPLPKLDMAAIPDFVSGAMEHWGLVTYRETSLLYNEETSSTVNKQRIASVIAHEFAHMWFGNLVTMMWWNDLWLNEGFASYIEDKGVDAVFPDWKMEDQFIVGTLHGVLNLDATLGSHPIIQPVTNPDQITEIFDTITYSKGSSIIRMLEDFMGPENFRKAVTNYLNEYKYKNAVTDDFLSECNKLNLGFDVKAIMSTWTEQMGLPVVEVVKVSDTQYRLTQKRFFSNPDDYNGVYNDSPFQYTWTIPLTYETNVDREVHRVWFNYYEKELFINVPTGVTWIKFNYNQVGYYRVNYEKDLWESLANQLSENPTIFSVGDRASLLNDAFSLADSTQLPYDLALEMTKYLSDEQDYVPWAVATSKLTSLKRNLMYTEVFTDYNEYSHELIEEIYDIVGWNVDDNHLRNRLRVNVLTAACSLGLKKCLTEAANRFNAFLENPNQRPHADVREIVYYYGIMAVGDEQNWHQMWDLFIREEDASEKSKLMYGLSAVQVPWLLSRFVQLAWNEEYVRGQDYFTCLQNIAANPVGEPIVWDYVREQWLRLVDRFGLNERYLGNLIPSITGRFSTQTKLDEMEYFFAKYPEAGAGTAARVRALENVKNNIVWLENNRESIGHWLKNHLSV